MAIIVIDYLCIFVTLYTYVYLIECAINLLKSAQYECKAIYPWGNKLSGLTSYPKVIYHVYESSYLVFPQKSGYA